MMLRISLAVTIFSFCILGQQPAHDPAFEVATVKPSARNQNGFGIDTAAGSLIMRNFTLRQAIQFAYRLHEDQMAGGPKWVDSDGYDIVGKPGDSLRELRSTDRSDRMRAMLRTLLAERFQLTMRRETKEVPAFALAIAKNGFLLKRVEPGGEKRSYGRPDELVANGATVAEFASILETKLQQPVLNRTGIEGLYDFRVQFAPDNVPDSPYPSIFTALQEQCGLKLGHTTAPADVFVIERAERPSEN